jgi:mannosyltransferase OCH1-like enzyme
MGYFFPVQLTQWSFAWAPGHPILQIFIDRLLETVRAVRKDASHQLLSDSSQQELSYIDPVNLTGPIAFTDSVRTWLDMKADLRWNALTGLEDGGASKLVEDVLVLPITGFR